MTGFRFQDPIWIAAIVPIVLVSAWSLRRERKFAVLFSSLRGLRSLPVTAAQRVKRILPNVRIAGLSCLALAMARPQQGHEEFRLRGEGIAIEMAIDRSGSMQAMDFEESGQRRRRLDVVKRVFRDFVAGRGKLSGRPDDLIGLVVFGGFAEGRCPLTLDHGALLQILEDVDIPKPLRDARGKVLNAELYEEEMATAIGDAIVLGVERLKAVPAKSKVLILLSDGVSNAGVADPLQAAEVAKAFGVKVYTIGVGSTGTAPFPAEDAFGRSVLVRRQVELNEATLKRIAEATGGRYFNARGTAALEEVYAAIDQLEKTETEGVVYTEYKEWFHVPLIAGALLILGELALSMTRFLSLP
ncbi:MAG: VWA domain-containing protein [Planctomycetes bacterium]|nr:VWA domain-containing protein [Planctomycetota bacterium]